MEVGDLGMDGVVIEMAELTMRIAMKVARSREGRVRIRKRDMVVRVVDGMCCVMAVVEGKAG